MFSNLFKPVLHQQIFCDKFIETNIFCRCKWGICLGMYFKTKNRILSFNVVENLPIKINSS